MRYGLLVSLLLVARSLSAQTISSYELQTYQPGVSPATGAPFQVQVIPATSVVCNQAPLTTSGTVINPRTVRWTDPTNAGRDCLVDQNAFLLALPVLLSGAYVATLTASNEAGPSARSAASNPFVRIVPPTVPQGLRVAP